MAAVEAATVGKEKAAPWRWLRRIRRPGTVQAWRLGSGLVLFAFVLTHYLNHALGHVSLEVMEAVQAWRSALWRSLPGTVLLYGALVVHACLALGRLVRRRTWRMAPWEAAQIALGLAIPVLLAAHLAVGRGLYSVEGINLTYVAQLRLLWPGLALTQSLLLVVVWLHAAVGLHHWLRTKAWYAAWSPALLALAVLVPTLALTGWIEAARRVALMSFPEAPLDDAGLQAGGRLIELTRTGALGLLAAALLAFAGLQVAARLRADLVIAYPDGRQVRGRSGGTLLEISRAAGVPIAAVCGGRGRCTTCRVQVVAGGAGLDPPNAVEAAALKRIDAPPGVRLACQIRPRAALGVRPLIPVNEARAVAQGDAMRWGVERRITILFADIRGFTTLAERLYPYDSVFFLNRYFAVMTAAIERHGGEVDKFLGDGIMALFGVTPAAGAGSRDALYAARAMLEALDALNAEFAATLREPLRIGIGIHTGPAILGRVGAGRAAGLTALGDSVNIASRLEGMTKAAGVALVVSEATLQAAHLTLDGAMPEEMPVRGLTEPLHVVMAADLKGLREAPPDTGRPAPSAASPSRPAAPAP